jgi:hypothetical protein
MDSDLEGSDGSAEHGRMHEEDRELDREWQARKQTFWNVRTEVHTFWCMLVRHFTQDGTFDSFCRPRQADYN